MLRGHRKRLTDEKEAEMVSWPFRHHAPITAANIWESLV